ncbi:MAG: alanine racemase [Gemmatimonadales bacterium]
MSVSMSGGGEGREGRAWIEVDLAALVDNARTVARIAGTRLLPIVKANAYGVGAVAASAALERLDPAPAGYGVATVAEGAELRAAGVTRPILVFLPARPELFESVHEFQLTPVLEDARAIHDWTARGARGGAFQLEIDTGMGRTGVRWDEIDTLADALDTPYLAGCFTQLHSADRPPPEESAERQLERFLEAVGRLARRPPLLHAANSAAALRDRKFALDLVRPGIFLYGGAPGEGLATPRPVVTVRARVVSVRQLPAGESVGYGGSWVAARDTTVATLGIGYADGVRRGLGASGRAQVLLRGRGCPVIGHVTMDLMMVDAGTGPVAVGDVATILGTDGDRTIALAEFAGWAGAISYEVLTGLGPRLPRIHR